MTQDKGRFLLITYRTEKSTFLTIAPLLILSFLIGKLYSSLDPLLYLFQSGSENYSFQVLEGLILVSVTIISGFLIVLALKKNLLKLLKIFYGCIFFISSISIFWVHGYFIEIVVSMDSFWLEIVFAVIGLLIGIFSVYIIILEKLEVLSKNILVFILGLAIGTVFGTVFPLVSFLSLLIFISVFDIYSVFKGPINSLLKRTNMSISSNQAPVVTTSVAIGIGDFVFYSAAVTFTTKEFGLALGFASIVGIIVGMKMTKNMLSRYGKFPGLPIPIFLSLILVLIGWLVSNYILPF